MLRRAYDLLEDGEDRIEGGDLEAGTDLVDRALAHASDVVELRFSAAVTLFTAGAHERGRELFHEAVAVEPHWRDVLERFVASGMVPEDVRDLAR